MQKFKLVKKDGTPYPGTEKGINQDKALDLLEDNDLVGIYKLEPISEITKASNSEISEVDFNQRLTEYRETLTGAELSDIREKRKSIHHNQERGFYLVNLKQGLRDGDKAGEHHFSFWQIEEKRNIELKFALKDLLWNVSRGQMVDFERSEVEDMINNVFKSNKVN